MVVGTPLLNINRTIVDGPESRPETDWEDIDGDVPEADFWPENFRLARDTPTIQKPGFPEADFGPEHSLAVCRQMTADNEGSICFPAELRGF